MELENVPILFKEHSSFSPLTHIAVQVNFGSGDEGLENLHGAAHLLEHVLVRAHFSALPELSASTGRDRTTYSILIHVREMDSILATLMKVFQPLALANEVLLTEEIAVVERERIERSSNLLWRAREATLSRLWSGTAYGHDTLGTKATLRNISYSDLQDIHFREYRPDNAMLIIVGPKEIGNYIPQNHLEPSGMLRRAPCLNDVQVFDIADSGGELGSSLCWQPASTSKVAVGLLNSLSDRVLLTLLPLRGGWLAWGWSAHHTDPRRELLDQLDVILSEDPPERVMDQLRKLEFRQLRANDKVENVGIDLANLLSTGIGPLAEPRDTLEVLCEWRDDLATYLD